MSFYFPEGVAYEKLPRITILMANYNYSKFLSAAIQSALKQTYPKFAVVMVDDCSTDDSFEIMQKECSKYATLQQEVDNDYVTIMVSKDNTKNPIMIIRLKSHVGVSEARNIGIEQSLNNTDYYQIFDVDDEIYPNKLSELAGTLFMSPSIGATYGDCDILNTTTGILLREYREPFDRERLVQECIVHSGAMINKDALVACKDDFGFYDRTMRTCEDYDLWMRISEKYMITHIPIALTLVRVQPENSTFTVDKSIWQQNWKRVVDKAKARYGQPV